MLTVISIIAILAGLLFPAIQSALRRAEVAKAQQVVSSNLATAFRSYHTEYGKWPLVPDVYPTPYEEPTIYVSTTLLGLLRGDDVNKDVPTGSGDANNTFGITYQGNPRKIQFLEVKTADLAIDPSNQKTNYVDPWGGIYRCRLDTDYSDRIQNPFWGVADQYLISAGFLVWSDGPDAQEDRSGDTPMPSPLNKDNVKSW